MSGRRELAIMTNGVLNAGEWGGHSIHEIPTEYLHFMLTTGLLMCCEADTVREEIRTREELPVATVVAESGGKDGE